MPYTTEQRSWLLKEYIKTKSADAVRVNWTAKYATAAPSRKTIYRIRHKFDATGSLLNVKSLFSRGVERFLGEKIFTKLKLCRHVP